MKLSYTCLKAMSGPQAFPVLHISSGYRPLLGFHLVHLLSAAGMLLLASCCHVFMALFIVSDHVRALVQMSF